MSEIKIVTDHKWRAFKYGYQVPNKIQQSDFEWLEGGEGFDGFISYRGDWYHLSEFLRLEDKIGPLHEAGWQGYHSDSYSGGIVIKVARNGESYQIGRFFC